MSVFTLRHPVFSLKREISLSAGTIVSDGMLESLIDSARADSAAMPLLDYGTVREDIREIIASAHYSVIYESEGAAESVMQDLENVRLPIVVLGCLDYFKEFDRYSYTHFLSVFTLSTLMARALVPDYKDLVAMAATGPTHDFGKICVPIEILTKRTPLTRTEKEIMDAHTIAGYVLLSYYCSEVGGMSARVARDHHERMNGLGRPRGINLDDVVTEIISVCDVYDALVSPRPYRSSSFDNRSALEEITDLGFKKEFSWRVIKTLISFNRKDKPHYEDVLITPVKRGTQPKENSHGKLAEDAAAPAFMK